MLKAGSLLRRDLDNFVTLSDNLSLTEARDERRQNRLQDSLVSEFQTALENHGT